MSRKISLRLPDELWSWLEAEAGDGPISQVVVDYLSRFRSGRVIRTITSPEWIDEFIDFGKRQGLGEATVRHVLERILSDAILHESCQEQKERLNEPKITSLNSGDEDTARAYRDDAEDESSRS